MISSTVLAATFGIVAVAQSTTVVDLMLPAVDPQALVGSVLDASPAITTYVIQCAENVKDASECGLLHATTIAQGPSTWSMHYSHSDEEFGSFEQDMVCDLDRDEDTIQCSVSMVDYYDGTTHTTSTAVSTNGLADLMVPVTITAGFDKLKAAPGATGGVSPAIRTEEARKELTEEASFTTKVTRPTPSATATDASETTESSESAEPSKSAETSESSQSTPTPSATGDEAAESTNTDNAAFPRATQNVLLAGVAALVGGAMVL